jgi:hypothetical protein
MVLGRSLVGCFFIFIIFFFTAIVAASTSIGALVFFLALGILVDFSVI